MPWNRGDIELIDWIPPTNVVPGFLPWRRFHNRTDVAVGHPRWKQEAHRYAGVYMFAVAQNLDGQMTRWLDASVIYIGRSDRELGTRLNEYRTWIPSRWALRLDDISVALLPVWFGDDDEPQDLAAHFVRYAERRLIWEHRRAGHVLRNDD